MKDKSENNDPLYRKCPSCGSQLKFYPGCCGNLPLWRCEECGILLKWEEKRAETDRYLTLK